MTTTSWGSPGACATCDATATRSRHGGLTGEQIPVASRITLACDAHHAMLSSRPYRAAMDPVAAVAELRDNAGTQIDCDVVDALLNVVAH